MSTAQVETSTTTTIDSNHINEGQAQVQAQNECSSNPPQPQPQSEGGGGDNETPNPASAEVHQSLKSLIETFEHVLSNVGDRKSSPQVNQKVASNTTSSDNADIAQQKPQPQSEPQSQVQSEHQNGFAEPSHSVSNEIEAPQKEVGHPGDGIAASAAAAPVDRTSEPGPERNASVDNVASTLSQCAISTDIKPEKADAIPIAVSIAEAVLNDSEVSGQPAAEGEVTRQNEATVQQAHAETAGTTSDPIQSESRHAEAQKEADRKQMEAETEAQGQVMPDVTQIASQDTAPESTDDTTNTQQQQRPLTYSASGTEIQEESLKNALKEIIHEIDQAVSSAESATDTKNTATTTTANAPTAATATAPAPREYQFNPVPGTPPQYFNQPAEFGLPISLPSDPFSYGYGGGGYGYDPSANAQAQPWCPSSSFPSSDPFSSSGGGYTCGPTSTSNFHPQQQPQQMYETYDMRSGSWDDQHSSSASVSGSSSLPYFLTRPSRLTPIPFAGYSGHPSSSNPDDPQPHSLSIESSSAKDYESVSWNHTKDTGNLMSEEKGMTVTSSGNSEYTVPKVDLEKIFTPAKDFDDHHYLSTRRKIFGSSSFYSETHPTVEEQVDLARKISQSLTDATNQKSKGQSMYVKRKKKSVKWIHEGPEGSFTGGEEESSVERSDENQDSAKNFQGKPNLKLVMNPTGQVYDLQSLKQSGMYNEHGLLSPEIRYNLIKDMHSPTGKGAQLFAKRRKKAEQWIVDDSNVKRSDTLPSLHSGTPGGAANKPFYTLPRNKPQFMPDPSFIDRSRVEHAQKLNEIQERFASRPKLRIIKSPWEAALETGSVDTAFEEIQQPVNPFAFVAAAERKLAKSPSMGSFGPLPPWQSENQPYKPPEVTPWEAQNYPSTYSGEFGIPPPPQNYSQPQPQAQAAPVPKRTSMLDFGTNYNTAPRGFSYGQTIYRPVVLN